MFFVSAPRSTRPETRAQGMRLPSANRQPAEEFAVDCQRLCHRVSCPADFSSSGGVATGSEVAERLRAEVGQPISLVARWIVDRHVIVFSCGARLWLPLFQFDFAQGCLRAGVAPAMAELAGVMDDDEVACWFAQPNAWLHGAAPAQTLLSDANAVLGAARADRLGVMG